MKKAVIKIGARLMFLIVALLLCLSVVAACGSEGATEPGVTVPGATDSGGEVQSVTLLYNGEEVEGDTLELMYDPDDPSKNVYTFTVRVNKTGEVDEVDEMVFWTSDAPNVATLKDNETEAEVTLTGERGSVTISVFSLLYSDTISDSITLNVSVPADPMATINGAGVYRLEGEDADLSRCEYGGTKAGGTIIEDTTTASTGGLYDASGGKVIGNLNKKGNIIEFCVQSDKPAKARLDLMLAASTYRSQDADNMNVPFDDVAETTINGSAFETGIAFEVYDENTWYRYNEYTATGEITLTEGVNYITIEVLTDGAPMDTNTKMPNIDYIELDVTEYDGQRPTSTVDNVTIMKDGAAAPDSEQVVYSAGTSSLTYTAKVDVTGELSTDVTWETSDDTVATVNNGVVELKGKAGSVTITASSVADPSRKDTIVLNVTVPLAIIDGADTYRLEAESAKLKNAKVENTSEYYLYTPGTAYTEAVQGSASGGKNTSMNAKGSSLTFEVWSDAARSVTLKVCCAPSTSTKSSVYSYAFDDCIKLSLNGDTVSGTGITVEIPEASEANGIGCYFYYTVYTSEVKLDLVEGLNTIVLSQIGEGYTNETRSPNFDYIELVAD